VARKKERPEKENGGQGVQLKEGREEKAEWQQGTRVIGEYQDKYRQSVKVRVVRMKTREDGHSGHT